ncbi:hypothetical protein BHE74_00049395 [Ensete ventricosum]|nr:hypothetical protein GW17_00000286 [Ensete ventricosum]RWW44813.1 hypothetical protein BHE74_00049395 [Ensete ventricosum]RZS22321.1 hypothetical protein BHM03_00055076 [Ensete ventricosum]
MVAQCMEAICGVGIVKGIMNHPYNSLGGGANLVAAVYSHGAFVLVYTVFSATDHKRSACDSHVPVCTNGRGGVPPLRAEGGGCREGFELLQEQPWRM